MLGQMMLRRFRAAELIEVSEVIFASGIDRLEVDRLSAEGVIWQRVRMLTAKFTVTAPG